MRRNSELALRTSLLESIKESIQYYTKDNEHESFTRDDILDYLNDYSHELIDGVIPVYYSDLASLLAENNSFAYVDDHGLLPENPDVWQIISTSIFEYLSSEFFELACDAVDELHPELSEEFN